MVKEFEDAALKGSQAEPSDPVKTQFGYHLIKVDERIDPALLDAYTLQTKQYEAYNTWLTDMRNAAEVVRAWTIEKIPPTPSPR